MNTARSWEIQNSPEGKQGQTIQEYLYFEGMYNPVVRFAFTNILDENFVSAWNSRPYVVKPRETVKLPHHLAAKFTREIVDILMNRDNKGLLMAVPENRKPYENKVLSMLPQEESMEMEVMKNEFIEELERDINRKEGESDSQSPSESISVDFEENSYKQDKIRGKKGR